MCVAMMFGCVVAAGCGSTDDKGRPQVADHTEDAAKTDDKEQPHVSGQTEAEVKTDGKDQTYGDWIASLPPDAAPGFACGLSPSMHPHIPLHFVDWSPDGTHLIFDDVTSVRIVDAQGTRLRQVVDANPGHQFPDDIGMHAAFSPDGQQVVYATCEYPTEGLRVAEDAPWTPRGEYEYEIATVGVDGSRASRRTSNQHYDHLPVWSPDGQRIAFLSADRPRYPMLRRLLTHSTGVAPNMLVEHATFAAAPPQWSPDGALLAVLAYAPQLEWGTKVIDEGGWGLIIVAADGTGERQIAETVSTVAWAPDGTRLAFVRLQNDEVQLITTADNGSDVQVITRVTNRALLSDHYDIPHSVYHVPLLHVAWSRDGEHILYTCEQQFCVVDLNGELIGRSPEKFAKERGRAAAAWAPDGSRIAVRAAGNPTPNGEVVLYTMAPDGTDVRVLVRGGLAMVAEHSGYEDAEVGHAACREGYVVPDPARNPGLVADCETLMAMRDSLAGQTLLNWGAGTPLDQWAGIQISGEPRRVTGLKFKFRQGVHWHESHRLIFGRLPPAIGKLDQLRTLDLCCHKLLGTFPPELEGLQHLQELNLRLHGGARLDGCLSAGFVEQLEVAEGLRVCGQERSR